MAKKRYKPEEISLWLRAQQASCVSAYGLNSGSLLTMSAERLSEDTDLLTHRGP